MNISKLTEHEIETIFDVTETLLTIFNGKHDRTNLPAIAKDISIKFDNKYFGNSWINDDYQETIESFTIVEYGKLFEE